MLDEQCHACRFWQEQKTGCVDDDERQMFGECRREPPRIIGTIAVAGERILLRKSPLIRPADLSDATLFPVTARIDWCGRFEWRADIDRTEAPIC